jgi:predicted glycosyltransferase
MTGPRVFFYVQHLLGIGHLVRANRIAQALIEVGLEVTMAMGGLPVQGFPAAGIQVIGLPPVKAGKAGFSALEGANGLPVDQAFMSARRGCLLAALAACKPDAVIVEAFPFGRRAMRFELLPFLEAARNMATKPLIACSVRDILQEGNKPERARDTVEAVNQFFDLVLVHGDPALSLFEETFPLASSIVKEMTYTGLVAGPPPAAPVEFFDVVISAGGGAAGFELVKAGSQLMNLLGRSYRCCLITGPNLPAAEIADLRADALPGADICTFREDFPSLLCGTRLSISQAGYNTVCDILRAGCKSLLIPFARGGETEQTTRARRLENLGIARVLPEDRLCSTSLVEAATFTLAGPPPRPHSLDLEGASRTASLIKTRLTA